MKNQKLLTNIEGEAAIPNSECSARHKKLNVFTDEGFTLKIPNEQTRKNSRRREKRGHQA